MTCLYVDGDRERRRLVSRGSNTQSEISDTRSEFRRDYCRVIHCPSFRRLIGKTQLFPGVESDFFRNRLTHSLEVAQVAKQIAADINQGHSEFQDQDRKLDLDLMEVSALIHDLGHPPFGHTGEKILNEMMEGNGGFEGNAQTIRIVARLEKKDVLQDENVKHPVCEQKDRRVGLNLTYRSIASGLKYDRVMPLDGKVTPAEGQPRKAGYYTSEKDLIDLIRSKILRAGTERELKTVECQIMDIADDIAYSTYDLEDTLKAEFETPLSMLASTEHTLQKVKEKISEDMGLQISTSEIRQILNWVFDDLAQRLESTQASEEFSKISRLWQYSQDIARNGYFRTAVSSTLLREFSHGIIARYNPDEPALSTVNLKEDVRVKVSILKHFCYQAVISSPRMRIVEFRAREIVKVLFETLVERAEKDKTIRILKELLPRDYQSIVDGFSGDERMQVRTVCDFISGMTDRYALEFYGRIKSENPATIFKPF